MDIDDADLQFDPFDFLESQADPTTEPVFSVSPESSSEKRRKITEDISDVSSTTKSQSSSSNASNNRTTSTRALDTYNNLYSSSAMTLFGPPVQPVPVIQNIVASCTLGCSLDLKDIATRAWNTEYDPRRFAAVKIRIRVPKGSALIYSSGKVVVSGFKSVHEAKIAAKKVACVLRSLSYSVAFQDFQLLNVVSLIDLQYPIQLDTLRQCNSSVTQYETEIFPALVYRITRDTGQKIVCMIFCNGKIVITGCKSLEDTETTSQYIASVVQPHRILSPLPSCSLPAMPFSHAFPSVFVPRVERLATESVTGSSSLPSEMLLM